MISKINKKGAQGIGTLIIFIALILVAALAAGVLISTVGKLQGKAENTGTEVQQRLGTGFEIIEVVASDTSDGKINNGTDNIRITLRLSPGSDAVKFGDITLSLVTDSGLQSYTNSTAPTTNTFNVSAVAGIVTDGYINRADVVNFDFVSQFTISENEEFTIRAFPGIGNPIPINIVTPPSMISTFTVLK